MPEDAWELNFTFNDGASWEQSPGNNGFRHRVNRSPWGTGAHLSLEDARKAAYAAADRKAIEKQDAVFFTMPEQPMPGAPVSIYFNRARSVLPRGAIPFARIGFDGWDAGRGVYELQMRETRMRKGDAIEWWRAEVEKCPQGCSQMDMVFHDGSGTWENNAGRDFAVACDEAPDVLPREVASQDVVDVAGGKMYVCKLAGYKGPSGRWAREKTLRVWTPPVSRCRSSLHVT